MPNPASPYRRLLPRDVEVEPDPLLIRLDFHHESVVLHEYADGVASSRLVSTIDIAHALASELDLDTGLLPPETLWYVKTAAGPRVALWCPPRPWSVRLQETYGERPRRFRLPMPGLVFLCLPAAQAPYVFAAKARPKTGDDELYHCPTWNVFRNGRVCPGTHVFPRDPARVPEEFFKSQFSPTGDSHGRSRAHPDDLLSLWAGLHGQQNYPVDDLMPALRLRDALRIGT
jgi:hypothetical protein